MHPYFSGSGENMLMQKTVLMTTDELQYICRTACVCVPLCMDICVWEFRTGNVKAEVVPWKQSLLHISAWVLSFHWRPRLMSTSHCNAQEGTSWRCHVPLFPSPSIDFLTYSARIYSRLSHCSSLLSDIKQKSLSCLQLVQNAATKVN